MHTYRVISRKGNPDHGLRIALADMKEIVCNLTFRHMKFRRSIKNNFGLSKARTLRLKTSC